MTFTSYGVGLTQASEGSLLLHARRTRRNGTAHGVILLHGHGGSALQYSPTPALQGAQAKALADSGLLVLAIDAAGVANFGNPAAMTAISSAKTWLQSATGGGAATGKVGLSGWSMGGLDALNWQKRNPTLVAGIWLWDPCTDLAWANGAGYGAEITTAFGSYGASAGYRVADEFSTWRGQCPIRVVHASDDNTVAYSQSQAFVAGVADPQVTLRSPAPTGDHTGVFDHVPAAEQIAFFSGLSY